ncbi:MAG: ATP-dependent Clp protease adaptor ClpS [Epsilonproteobacteria bacterium]|jgi:ATP-dependent Clp protease adaptor protein ClpS|nr:ATP-dependent Clp protease adaptor ClpS [Campylobacterota bacterium]NPA88894.1 ATP-dependent Clp protease adaptor ClpS [Campylobacterota bacterium]
MGLQIEEHQEVELEAITPRLYKVILLNDDVTTFEFVIELLQDLFQKSFEEAVRLTFQIDREGSGVVGIYPKEIAEAKVEAVHQRAQMAGFPLRAVMEEE